MTTTTSPSPCAVPKAAQQLIADARRAGYAVTVRHDSVGITVSVDTGHGTSGSATWTAGDYHSGPVNSQLGFHTIPGRPGVRFDYAGVELAHAAPGDRYPHVPSVRRLRGYLGL